MTSSCPNSAEGAVELVQLRLVGVQHLEVDRGFSKQARLRGEK